MKTHELINGTHTTTHNVLHHSVEFRYWGENIKMEESIYPNESELSHVKESILQGFYSGELNMLMEDDREIRGWWEIVR